MIFSKVKCAYKEHTGTYDCRARNQFGEAMSDIISVTVVCGDANGKNNKIMWPGIQWNLYTPHLIVTHFCVLNRRVFGLYRLIWQIFPTLGLYFKFGLYWILFYSGFSLDRFQRTRFLLKILHIFDVFINEYLQMYTGAIVAVAIW